MFDGFFDNKQPLNSTAVSSERTDKIKAAVLKELNESEDKPMKKINIARPFIIAAAVAALGAGALVSANIATDGEQRNDFISNSEQWEKYIEGGKLLNEYTDVFTVKVNGEVREMEGTCSIYEKDGEKIYSYAFEVGDECKDPSFEFEVIDDEYVE